MPVDEEVVPVLDFIILMFSGAWKEANAEEIHIEVADVNITVNALHIVLGSLYQDEIAVEPAQVVSVLGASILFQLDPLIVQCCDIMKETTNFQTVIKYYNAANEYGLIEIKNECFTWLLGNLLGYLSEYPKHLRDISIDLMVQLISSPQFCVIQTEFSIYTLLKMWVFLQENHMWEGTQADCILEAHKFFQTARTSESYLKMNQGAQYMPVFKVLRLNHLVNHHMDVEMIETDNIMPSSWLLPVYKNLWYQMLKIDQGVDKGPKVVSEEEFNKHCLRCGRILPSDSQHIWRWTGYNFGLDLIVTYDKRTIKLRRNSRGDNENSHSANQTSRRHIFYRFTVGSINEQKQMKFLDTTALQSITLSKNEEIRVLTVNRDATFPLMLSANFLVVSPLTSLAS